MISCESNWMQRTYRQRAPVRSTNLGLILSHYTTWCWIAKQSSAPLSTRKESRGAHTRSDYPKKDDVNWFVNIVVKQKDGQMSLETRPVPKMPPEFAELIDRRETLLWKK